MVTFDVRMGNHIIVIHLPFMFQLEMFEVVLLAKNFFCQYQHSSFKLYSLRCVTYFSFLSTSSFCKLLCLNLFWDGLQILFCYYLDKI